MKPSSLKKQQKNLLKSDHTEVKSKMAKIYYNKIKNSGGAFTIDDVPERWRAAVQALLDEEE